MAAEPDTENRRRKTTLLLQDWHEGKQSALNVILEKHITFLRNHVRKHAASALLAKFDIDDFVQDTVTQILMYAPRFQVKDGQHLRALLGRMVMSSLSEKWKYLTAMRRDMNREAQIPSDSVLCLDPHAASVMRPSQCAMQEEEEAWVRLGLELTKDEDRVVILMREWEEKTFPQIAEALGIQVDAARMRYHRALERLSQIVKCLRDGRVPGEAA